MSATDLPALLSRLEAAEGPSRELDLEIARALVPDVICLRQRTDPVTGERRAGDNEEFVHWTYTASLDAAIALCERVLPGWVWGVNGLDPEVEACVAEVWLKGSGREYAEAPTPALALCIAIVKALIAQEKDKQDE